MRDHFKSEHFLCEEDECADEQFTAVFRSEIDLRAHVATTHSKNMSRSEVKQARTIDLEFSYGPRGRSGNSHDSGGRNHDRGRIRTNDTQREFDRIPEQTIVQQAPIQIDSKNEQQFPSLGGPSGGGGPSVQLANTVRHINYGTSGLARTKENFPALGGAPVSEKPFSQPTTAAKGKQYRMPSASSMLKGPGSGSKSMTNINNRPPSSTSSSSAGLKKTSSDFPALSQSTNNKKNRNKVDLLEDMILPVSNVNMNLVSSKHRGLVEDNYVSMASRVSKVQTVQRKDVQVVPDAVKKNVPKLSSVDNFPTLGNGAEASNASAPQWLTVKSNQKYQPQQEPKKGKKIHEMPTKAFEKPQTPQIATKPEPQVKAVVKPQNGVKKVNEGKKMTNGGVEKEKQKQSNNKENLLAEKNFPTLGTDATPPPGFMSASQPSKKQPPPGFSNISSGSEPRSISILEFTNSVQEKLKKDSSPIEHSYVAPQNANKRNQALVNEFQKTLKTSESMQEFRHVSQMFRDGNYFAKSYYETCKFVLGAGFESIFPELLALLPDIQKQQVSATGNKLIVLGLTTYFSQSLYAVYLEELKEAESSGAKPKKKNKSKELEVCATCQQVLLMSDLMNHVQSHTLENNFPVLNEGVKEASAIKQWKK